MPAVKSSLVHPRYKTEYRVRNWREYEQGLRDRGDVTVWFSDNAVANWISRSSGAPDGTVMRPLRAPGRVPPDKTYPPWSWNVTDQTQPSMPEWMTDDAKWQAALDAQG